MTTCKTGRAQALPSFLELAGPPTKKKWGLLQHPLQLFFLFKEKLLEVKPCSIFGEMMNDGSIWIMMNPLLLKKRWCFGNQLTKTRWFPRKVQHTPRAHPRESPKLSMKGNPLIYHVGPVKVARGVFWSSSVLKKLQMVGLFQSLNKVIQILDIWKITSWWFQPIRKNISQNENLPQMGGEHKQYLKPPTVDYLFMIPGLFIQVQSEWTGVVSLVSYNYLLHIPWDLPFHTSSLRGSWGFIGFLSPKQIECLSTVTGFWQPPTYKDILLMEEIPNNHLGCIEPCN